MEIVRVYERYNVCVSGGTKRVHVYVRERGRKAESMMEVDRVCEMFRGRERSGDV